MANDLLRRYNYLGVIPNKAMDILEKFHGSIAELLAHKQIFALLKRAVGAKSKLPEILITCPPQPTLGDFSVSCFELGKMLQQSPVEAARVIAAVWENSDR